MKERNRYMAAKCRKYPVKRMNVNINMKETGARIKQTLKDHGYSVSDIMEITGITTPQTIYKWFRGDSLPALENQIVLGKILGCQITDLLVIDGEIPAYNHNYSLEDVIIIILRTLHTFRKDNIMPVVDYMLQKAS